MIVGSAKCGTTALASVLGTHPDCCMSNPKEVSFFQDTVDFAPNPNFEKGWEWYQKSFAHYAGEKVVGEATPSYSDRTRSPNTAARIKEFNPEMKIIYMVRDPLQRQISAWRMQHSMGLAQTNPHRREHKWALQGFETWLTQQRDTGQWDECKYNYQLEAYLEHFSRENVFVSFLEDWKNEQESVVDRCCNFLDLDSGRLSDPDTKKGNRAVDRQIERPGLKRLRTSTLARTIVPLVPRGLRDLARRKLALRKAPVVSPGELTAVATEFLEYVGPDCRTFLTDFGKDTDFWASLASVPAPSLGSKS